MKGGQHLFFLAILVRKYAFGRWDPQDLWPGSEEIKFVGLVMGSDNIRDLLWKKTILEKIWKWMNLKCGEYNYTLWSLWLPGIIGDTVSPCFLSMVVKTSMASTEFCASCVVEKAKGRGRTDWTRRRAHANMDMQCKKSDSDTLSHNSILWRRHQLCQEIKSSQALETVGAWICYWILERMAIWYKRAWFLNWSDKKVKKLWYFSVSCLLTLTTILIKLLVRPGDLRPFLVPSYVR